MYKTRTIFFMHYILNFVDNDYQIYDSLSDTFCGEYLSNDSTDQMNIWPIKCYEFILSDNYFKILCENEKQIDLLKEKKWILSYLNMIVQKTRANDGQIHSDHSISITIDNQNYEIFHVKEINMMIEKSLFVDILKYCYEYEKYTVKGMITIIHSGIFRILDNKIIILRNIIQFLIDESLSLDDLEMAFLKDLIKNIQSFELTEIQQLYEKEEPSLILNRIIEKLQEYESNEFLEDFHDEIIEWSYNLAILFSMIRNNFFFSVSNNDNEVILNIKNDLKANIELKLKIECFKSLKSFFEDEFFFIIESITEQITIHIKNFISIANIRKIKIDLTRYFFKFRNMKHKVIIKENKILHELVVSLLKLENKQLLIIIKEYQFEFKLNQNEIYEIIDITKDKIELMDEALLVGKYILVSQLCSSLLPLTEICKLILKNYNHHLQNNEHVSYDISKTLKRTFFMKNSNNVSYKNDMLLVHDYRYREIGKLDTYRLLLRGDTMNKPKFLGIKFEEIEFADCEYVYGIYDGDFSMFFFNNEKNENGSLQILSFDFNQERKNDHNFHIEKVNQKLNSITDKKNRKENINLESIILCINFDVDNFSLYKLSKKMIEHQSPFSDIRKTEMFRSPGCHSFSSKIGKKDLLLINVIDSKSQNEKNQQEKYTIIPDNICLPNNQRFQDHGFFKIKNSNFQFIFSRIMELISKKLNISEFAALYTENGLKMRVIHCDCAFLNPFEFEIANIEFFDCIFVNPMILSANVFKQRKISIVIKNTCFQSIIADCFELKAISRSYSHVKIEKQRKKVVYKIASCEIYVLNDISDTITSLYFDQCEFKFKEINSTNCSLLLNSSDSQFKIRQKSKNSLPIAKNSLPKQEYQLYITNTISKNHILIEGCFDYICITNCDFKCTINCFFGRAFIIDHRGVFSFNNILINAVSKNLKSSFEFKDDECIIKGLKIHKLCNLRCQSLEISSCDIQIMDKIKFKRIHIKDSKCSFKFKQNKKTEIHQKHIHNFEKKSDLFITMEISAHENS